MTDPTPLPTPPVPRRIAGLGWVPSLPDPRDIKFRVTAPVPVPPVTDLRPGMPLVYDQGQIGSCTANAIGAAVQYDRRRQGLGPDFVPDRLAIYYEERRLEGTVRQDSGAMIRDGMRVVNRVGIASEELWPYQADKFAVKPPAAYYTEARKHLVARYAAVSQNINALRQVLATGLPIVIGITVMESFESQQVADTGIVPLPTQGEAVLGGHAVLVIGHSDPEQRFLCRNSWSDAWGGPMRGYFTLPFAYLANPSLTSDWWVVQVCG